MKLFGGTLNVGQVHGRLPRLDFEANALRRVVLSNSAEREEAVRLALDQSPSIDIVDDPLGAFHEAVPYESLVVVGPSQLAGNLKKTLPRFFGPLAFRRLNFEIRHVPAGTTTSLLFGDMLEARLEAPRGVVQLVRSDLAVEPVAPGVLMPERLAGGQGRATIAIGRGPAAEGLPAFDLAGAEAKRAIVLTPGHEGPRVQLWSLNSPGPDERSTPVLNKLEDEAVVTRNPLYEFYEARFRQDGGLGRDALLRIVPDSQFSRFLPTVRPKVDCLEIIGLLIPDPQRMREVAGVAVRFDGERRLIASGLRTESSRILLVGTRERSLQLANGVNTPLDRVGPVLGLGLELQRARAVDDRGFAKWSVLRTQGEEPLGWLPLRVGLGPFNTPQAPWRYARSGWISPGDLEGSGAALHLDWLNQAVRLVVRHKDGGTQEVGFATWCNGQGDNLLGQLAGVSDGVTRDPERPTTIRHRDTFRLGPLWVRYHKATG